MAKRRKFKANREEQSRQKLFPVVLTAEEHEYLMRLSRHHNVMASMLVRQRTFFRGWRRELTELREEQGNEPIANWDARRRWRASRRNYVDHLLVQGPQNQNGGRDDPPAGVSKG